MPNVLDYALPGASLASGIVSGIMNFGSQRENRQTQIDLMREQNAFNERMMDKQNAWNSESSKVQRLVAAGLNPALAFSDASDSGMAVGSNTPSIEAPQAQFSDVVNNAANVFATLALGNKDSEEAKGTAINNQTRAAYNLMTLEKLDSERGLNDVQKAYLQLQKRLANMNLGNSVEQASLANQETRMRMQLMQSQQEQIAVNNAYTKIQTALADTDLQFKPATLRAIIADYGASIAQKNALTGLTKKQTWHEYESTLTEIAKRHGVKLDNKQKSIMMPYLYDNFNYDFKLKKIEYQQRVRDYDNPLRWLGISGGSITPVIAKSL